MATQTEPIAPVPAAGRRSKGRVIISWLTTTDHKRIGHLYLITSFAFFLIAGVLAMLIRAELARPGLQLLSNEQYNQSFTMHGTIMLLLFATPTFAGFANAVMPLQIGSPDVAFPRLNMLSYWLFLFGGLIVLASFLTPQGAADFGWTAYTPLSGPLRAPYVGGDLWIMGLALSGFGTILGAVNFITTIICMRAPGLTIFRMPIFVWNVLLTSVLVLLAFPVLAAALLVLEADRHFGAHVFDAENGGAILWQHLFWFFGHPEVYILALPFFGVVTEIIPVFARKPVFGYMGLVGATIAIAGLSATVWAHHMFATGAVLLPFFSFLTYLIAVPTGVKFFNWIGTMWRGSLSFEPPMLWAAGFLVTFLFGGLTGVILGSPPLDWHVTDSYFVVAHFHYVLFGTIVFAMFGGFSFWWAEDDGPDARPPAGEGALLDAVRRFPHHVPGAALARRGGHAAPVRGLSGRRRLHGPEHRLLRRRLPAGAVDAAVPLQRLEDRQVRAAGRGRRPLGVRAFPGVGHVLSPAAPQLPRAAPGAFRVAGLRPEPPRAGPLRPGRADGAARRRGAGRRAQGRPFVTGRVRAPVRR
ncbi:hypothetical protein GCM10010385_19800 [Streptomyces geysiriensis]|nr:hypothetical protein GCM10010385_19800 [Streptomyces geysiriensis]